MMIADRFVFLRLHKSGGTFVNECILRFVPGAKAVEWRVSASSCWSYSRLLGRK
jgi:hypothetical protein